MIWLGQRETILENGDLWDMLEIKNTLLVLIRVGLSTVKSMAKNTNVDFYGQGTD